jgi:hypothetical protein
MKKPIDRQDLTSTKYGQWFLDLAHRNRVRDTGILGKYRTDPLGIEPVFIPIGDRAFWFEDEQRQRLAPWLNALEQIDRNGDKGPLMEELRSERELPLEVHHYLADLLDRYELKPPAHRHRAPAYDLTKSEARLMMLKDRVETFQKHGMNFNDAVDKVAEQWSMNAQILANFCQGKRGSSNRRKKREPPRRR